MIELRWISGDTGYSLTENNTQFIKLLKRTEVWCLFSWLVFSVMKMVFICFFEAGSHCVDLASLEFTMEGRLASNSLRFICLCLLSAGI